MNEICLGHYSACRPLDASPGPTDRYSALLRRKDRKWMRNGRFVAFRAWAGKGNRMAATKAMMAMTTGNSIPVKARRHIRRAPCRLCIFARLVYDIMQDGGGGSRSTGDRLNAARQEKAYRAGCTYLAVIRGTVGARIQRGRPEQRSSIVPCGDNRHQPFTSESLRFTCGDCCAPLRGQGKDLRRHAFPAQTGLYGRPGCLSARA